MKKILITGANSYIGMSFETYMKQWSDEYQIDTVDMIDGTWIEKDFGGYDTVFHVAGIAHIKETKQNEELYYKVNRDLAIEVAKKAKQDGIKQFIFLSSMSVYGVDIGVITRETRETPKSAYGKSKLEAEQGINLLHNNEFKVCTLRPPMVYGKGCKGNYVTLSKYAKKIPIFPDIRNKRSMIYIENLCEFIRLMVINQESGVYMPQNKEYICTSNLVKTIADINGIKVYFIHHIDSLIYVSARVSKVIRKVFGDLYYDAEISDYKESYLITEFPESVLKCEKQNS